MDLLCTHCSALFSSQDLTPSVGAVSHHQTVGELSQSGAACALCRILYDFSSLQYLRNRFADVQGHGSDPLPVELKVLNVGHSETTGVLWFILEGEIHVKHHKFTAGFKVTVTSHSRDELIVRSPLWNGQDSSFERKCAVVSSWMNDCIANHSHCAPPSNGAYPTRLICVGIGDENPRLIETRSEALRTPPMYAALSHCWGVVRSLKLSRANLLELQREIPLKDLPRTFREAIQVMRQVHIPYIWIDSLCIIQDDQEDWGREAARMRQIYSGSAVVISAEDSKDSLQGCFVDAEQSSTGTPRRIQTRTLTVQPQGSDTTLDVRVYDHDVESPIKTNVLRTRGWTLQEELLAHREIICARPELRWRCQRMQKTETGHEFTVSDSLYRIHSSGILQEKRWLWCDWMADYSSRDFTFATDRLSALVGIIQHYSQKTGYQHILACWRETMMDDLLWLRGEHLVASTENLAFIPSWSWLSRAHNVDFDMWNRRLDDSVLGRRQEDNTAVIKASINWAGEPMLSNLLTSTLILEGPVKELKLRVDERARKFNPPYMNVGDEELEVGRADQGGNPIPWRCAGQFDNEIIREDHRYSCLLMRSRWFNREKQGSSVAEVIETFLILVGERRSDGDEVFRRVGIGMIRGEESMFSNASRTRVRLV